MKKLVLSLFTLVAFTVGAIAQGNVTIQVSSGGNAVAGQLVLFFDDIQDLGYVNQTPENFYNFRYTNSNGEVTFSYPNNPVSNDTVAWATLDCQDQLVWGAQTVNAINGPQPLPLNCAGGACQSFVFDQLLGNPGYLIIEALAVRDTGYINTPGLVNHTYTYNGNTVVTGAGASANYDTIMVPVDSTTPAHISVCYSRFDTCVDICDSVATGGSGSGGGGTPFACQANYFVDSINSGSFQGQIILGEASTTSAGQIVDWEWDFGDGTTLNAQYPSHTYNSATGVYNVCLTITAVDGQDTCSSTFCDSIGFDSNGNIVFKQGFTINVVDPATFSVEEVKVSDFNLFPNPSKGKATLSWENAYEVNNVEVYTISGQRLQVLQPNGTQRMELTNLSSGAYIVRVNTESGSAPLKLIVE